MAFRILEKSELQMELINWFAELPLIYVHLILGTALVFDMCSDANPT
jgi:hypothetical protein